MIILTPKMALQVNQTCCMKTDEIIRYTLKNQVNLDSLIVDNHSISKAKFGLIFLKSVL